MGWILRVFGGLAAAAVLATLAGALWPTAPIVVREIAIDRPPSTVYTLVSRMRTYPEWAGAPALLQGATATFEGPEFGPGSALVWRWPDGRRERLAIASAVQDARVEHARTGPRGVASRSTFDVVPRDGGATLRWTYRPLTSRLNAPQRLRWAFGGADEAGARMREALVALTVIAERGESADFAGAGVSPVTVEATALAMVSARVNGDNAALLAAREEAFARLDAYLASQGLRRDGPYRLITREWAPPVWAFDAAAPFTGAPRGTAGETGGRVARGYEGRAARVALEDEGADGGGARDLPPYRPLEAYAAARRTQAAGDAFVVYAHGGRPGAPGVIEIFAPIG